MRGVGGTRSSRWVWSMNIHLIINQRIKRCSSHNNAVTFIPFLFFFFFPPSPALSSLSLSPSLYYPCTFAPLCLFPSQKSKFRQCQLWALEALSLAPFSTVIPILPTFPPEGIHLPCSSPSSSFNSKIIIIIFILILIIIINLNNLAIYINQRNIPLILISLQIILGPQHIRMRSLYFL